MDNIIRSEQELVRRGKLNKIREFCNPYPDKYDITKHPKYKQLSDYDEGNAFHIEEYLKHHMKLKASDTFETYQVPASEVSTK